jgi:hypothetical protein
VKTRPYLGLVLEKIPKNFLGGQITPRDMPMVRTKVGDHSGMGRIGRMKGARSWEMEWG